MQQFLGDFELPVLLHILLVPCRGVPWWLRIYTQGQISDFELLIIYYSEGDSVLPVLLHLVVVPARVGDVLLLHLYRGVPLRPARNTLL